MKRKIILTVIAAMMIMTGCGKKPSESQAEPTTKSTQ